MSNYNITPVIQDGFVLTIAVEEFESSEIDLQGNTLAGLYIPSNYSGTSIKINARLTSGGESYTASYGGDDISYDVVAGKYCPISPIETAGIRFLTIESNIAQVSTPANIIPAVRYI